MLDFADDARRPARPSLVEDAYRALKAAVRDNTLPPGFQGSEQELAQRLGMSRTPVHEAVIRLQEEGLVRVLPRRGVVVCAISPEDIREIYDVIVALEATAAGLLAGKPADERSSAAAALEAANAEMEAALGADDLDRWARADERFHALLVERCGNGRLARMLSAVMDQSHRARMFTLRLRPKPVDSVPQHGLIVEAVRRGDAPSAGEHARRHRLAARELIVPLLARYGVKRL